MGVVLTSGLTFFCLISLSWMVELSMVNLLYFLRERERERGGGAGLGERKREGGGGVNYES